MGYCEAFLFMTIIHDSSSHVQFSLHFFARHLKSLSGFVPILRLWFYFIFIIRHAILQEDLKDEYLAFEAEAKRGMLKLEHPVERGIVKNWDAMERLWSYTFSEQLGVDSSDHAVLITEPPLNPLKNKEKMTSMLFETFCIPAMYIKTQAVLALHAAGCTTGCAVDCGDGVTHMVPVYEGYTIDTAVQRLDLAGGDLTRFLSKLMRERSYTFDTSAEREIVRAIKEKLCYFSQDYFEDESNVAGILDLEKEYELPDGNIVTVGPERYRCPEALFQPYLIGMELPGLHACVNKAINSCERDVRKELYGNIVLSGGTTMIPGLAQRLQHEVCELVGKPAAADVRVLAPDNRQYSVWLGGSILTSLQNFESMWVTKEDYAEYGPNIVHSKFF